jgi:hypothetical protein
MFVTFHSHVAPTKFNEYYPGIGECYVGTYESIVGRHLLPCGSCMGEDFWGLGVVTALMLFIVIYDIAYSKTESAPELTNWSHVRILWFEESGVKFHLALLRSTRVHYTPGNSVFNLSLNFNFNALFAWKILIALKTRLKFEIYNALNIFFLLWACLDICHQIKC